MKFKAIGFDYGGVIGGVDTTGSKFTERVCDLLNIEKEEYRTIYFSLNQKINLGEITSWREFWKLFLDRLGRPDHLDVLMVLSDETQNYLRVIDPDMVELVDSIRTLGYKTGLLSNNRRGRK